MTKHDAIAKLHPNVVIIRDDAAFDADGNPVAYDDAAVQALMVSNAYKGKRANEYPPIADQLDTLYHGGFDAWKATIQAVKDKYPKEQA
jgi:hypothetical protein